MTFVLNDLKEKEKNTRNERKVNVHGLKKVYGLVWRQTLMVETSFCFFTCKTIKQGWEAA
jgi:hypothetical protein